MTDNRNNDNNNNNKQNTDSASSSYFTAITLPPSVTMFTISQNIVSCDLFISRFITSGDNFNGKKQHN